MLKPTIGNVALYFLVKYLLFYAGNIVYQGSYQWLDLTGLKTAQDVFFWLWMFGFLPVVSILLFAVPLWLVLRLSHPLSFGLALAAFVVADYAWYSYLFPGKLLSGYNLHHALIGVVVLALLFCRRIRVIVTGVGQ